MSPHGGICVGIKVFNSIQSLDQALASNVARAIQFNSVKETKLKRKIKRKTKHYRNVKLNTIET